MDELLWLGLARRTWVGIVVGASLAVSLAAALASRALVDRDVVAQGMPFIGGDSLGLRSVWGRGAFLFVALVFWGGFLVLSDGGMDTVIGCLLFSAMIVMGAEMLFPGLLTPGSVGGVDRFFARKPGVAVRGAALLAKFSHRVSEGIAFLCFGSALLCFAVRAWIEPWSFLEDQGGATRWVATALPGIFGALGFVAGMFALFDGEYEQNLLVLTPDWFSFPAASKREVRAVSWSDVHAFRVREDQELVRYRAEDDAGDGHEVLVPQTGDYLEALDADGETIGRMLLTGLPRRERFGLVLDELRRSPSRRALLAQPESVAWVRRLAESQTGPGGAVGA